MTGYVFSQVFLQVSKFAPLKLAALKLAALGAAGVALLPALASAQPDSPANTKSLKSLFQSGAETNGPQPSAQLTPPNAKQSARQQVEEIEALRKRMGGGVGERLKGLLPGMDPDEKFHDSLATLAQQNEATPAGSGTRSPNLVQTLEAPAQGPLGKQSALRYSAAELERLAAKLESVAMYNQADQLRRAATDFWQAARALD